MDEHELNAATHDVPFPGMIASVTEPSLKALNSAVQARDSKAFDKA